MKTLTIKPAIFVILCISFAISGCIEEKYIPETTENEEIILRITASLSGDDSETRLGYYEDGKAIKTLWEYGDILTANPSPGSNKNAYTFTLSDGAGTATGVFECKTTPNGYLPHNYHSNAWTIYYPGNMIKDEADYLAFSYNGQVQTGDNSLEHLEKYHSIRLVCTDIETSTGFYNTFIDFSGEQANESSCLKLCLSGLPQMTPAELSIEYSAPSGKNSYCFHTYNYLTTWWSGAGNPNSETSNKMTLKLEGFSPCTSLTAYMMLSNYPVDLHAGGTLRISVKSDEGKKYICEKTLRSDATLEGGKLHKISGAGWKETEIGTIDGFDNPEEGIVVLQEATEGQGTDIVIMGDGFSKSHFENGNYEKIMKKAYNDFFSIEPYASLKEYFNVYYINAVSEEDHDAVPTGLNGAQQGDAKTVFNTEFKEGSTNITGNDNAVVAYAEQAIRVKGGKGGTECSANDVSSRANKALMIVMVNVECHAGTCDMVWTNGSDYGDGYSVAYTALHTDEEGRRWTMLHEAGGHGFGKLSDEYEQYQLHNSVPRFGIHWTLSTLVASSAT